jgi:23S rRNA (uracil1939-C5)-methyltransferase
MFLLYFYYISMVISNRCNQYMNIICKHFSQCGGCRFQDIPYQSQLADKHARVKDLLEALGVSCDLKPIQHAEPWYYRNKMEFSFSRDNNGGIICGLYSKVVKRQVVDLEECLIFSKDAGAILKAVKKYGEEKKHSVYDKFTHQGFLRNLIIRETKFTNQLMIGLVTTTAEEFDRESFLKAICALDFKARLSSVFWIKNDSWSDAVVFEKKELLYGSETIRERLGDLEFNIGIDTFFQVNPVMINNFYKKVSEYVHPSSEENVLDLFCGVGSIGIFLAQKAKFVWGVEVHKEIVDLAWANAKHNRINNISFFVSDARRFLNTQGIYYRDVDILVINPPRCGLSPKILRAIFRLNPRRILYSSCNPEALFRDLEIIKSGYNLNFVESFDFFPHTPHMEVCSLLHKIPS